MKICRTLFTTLFLISSILTAQNHNTGTITGTVLIESTKSPLEFVNVVVLNQPDSMLVTGAVTDNKGKFEIDNVPVGTYFIKIGRAQV
jgi:hypothetical protein